MKFTSALYGLFLVIVLITYWNIKQPKFRLWTIIISSIVFYASWDVQYIPLIIVLTFINFRLGLESTDYGRAVIEMAQQIMAGQAAVIPEEFRKNEQIKKAIVDYAGEYLGVMSLYYDTSEWLGSGDKKAGFTQWLGGDIGSLIVNFPSESNTALADSFAEIKNAKTGHTVSISSKGTGGGAPPSISSLKVPEHLKSKPEYETAIDIIELCSNKSIPNPKTISQVFLMMNLLHERIPNKIPSNVPIKIYNVSKNTSILINCPNPSWHPDDPDTIS